MVSNSHSQSFEADDNLPDAQQILGVAIFDLHHLPREYFITPQHPDTDWIQLTFQSLGLQQLLAIDMELSALNYAIIRTKAGNIAIVPSAEGFIAVLLKRAVPQDSPNVNQEWILWLQDFVDTVVRTDPINFKAM